MNNDALFYFCKSVRLSDRWNPLLHSYFTKSKDELGSRPQWKFSINNRKFPRLCLLQPPLMNQSEFCNDTGMLSQQSSASAIFKDLTFILKLAGILDFAPAELRWPYRWRIFMNICIITPLATFSVMSIIYSIKHSNVIDAIKSAGYAYNSAIVSILIYSFLIANKDGFEQMIGMWEEIIRRSEYIENLAQIQK